VGGFSSSEQAYTTQYMVLVAFARHCASRLFAPANPYARDDVPVGRQGRSWLLGWVRDIKVGGRWCRCDEDVEGRN